MTAHSYTVWVYKSTATSLSSAGVAYTFASQLADVPQPATPAIRPLEGRAEAQGWTVSVVDSGSTVTGILSDSTGRFHLLNRLCAVRRAVDGSTAAFLGVGRIADVSLDPAVASYTLTLDDEHRLARITDIFTTNTTRLLPGSPHVSYGPFLVSDPMLISAVHRAPMPSSGTQAFVLLPESFADYDAVVAAVTEDFSSWNNYRGMNASSAAGNYRYLRLRVWGAGVTNPNQSTVYTDCPVIGFPDSGRWTVDAGEDPSIGLINDTASRNTTRGPIVDPRAVVVYASTTVIPNNPLNSTAYRRYAALHKMGAPPSELTPLHLGGVTGQHPGVIARAIYAGTYSSSGARLPRISTAAFDTWEADARYPLMRFRVTQGKQSMARWLEDNVYAPNMVVPCVDAQGRIAPKSLLQPQSSASVTYTFTEATLRAPHPTFTNTAQDQVTVASYAYTHEMAPRRYVVRLAPYNVFTRRTRPEGAEPAGFGGDLIAVSNRETERLSRTTVHGRQVVGFAANGWHTEMLGNNPSLLQTAINTLYGNKAQTNASLMAGHLLDRFADGAVVGTLYAMSTAETVQPGDYVGLTVGSYPNAETQARGGTRYVQILSRQDTPQGPIYQYLDAGPSAQPTAAPSAVTVSAGPSGSTKHSLTVAVGGVAGRAYVQMAFGSTRPPAASTRWESAFDTASTATRTVYGLPANTTAHVRAWNVRPRRFASTFVYSSKRATAALAAVTGFGPSTVGTRHIGVTWTNGEAGLPADLHATTSTGASFGSSNYVASVLAGVNRYTYVGLSSNTKYKVGVRHRDAYGGVSAAASYTTQTANTTAGLLTAPSVTSVTILYGAST